MHSGKNIDETTADKMKPKIAYNCTKGGMDTVNYMCQKTTVLQEEMYVGRGLYFTH